MPSNVDWASIRHFHAPEVSCPCCGREGVTQALMSMLDTLRERMGAPIKINSAYRCPTHNAKVGGEQNSVHTHGLAADIHIPDSGYRYGLVKHLYSLGVRRIGIYPSFVHADVAGSDNVTGPWPVDVIWYGK